MSVLRLHLSLCYIFYPCVIRFLTKFPCSNVASAETSLVQPLQITSSLHLPVCLVVRYTVIIWAQCPHAPPLYAEPRVKAVTYAWSQWSLLVPK